MCKIKLIIGVSPSWYVYIHRIISQRYYCFYNPLIFCKTIPVRGVHIQYLRKVSKSINIYCISSGLPAKSLFERCFEKFTSKCIYFFNWLKMTFWVSNWKQFSKKLKFSNFFRFFPPLSGGSRRVRSGGLLEWLMSHFFTNFTEVGPIFLKIIKIEVWHLFVLFVCFNTIQIFILFLIFVFLILAARCSFDC